MQKLALRSLVYIGILAFLGYVLNVMNRFAEEDAGWGADQEFLSEDSTDPGDTREFPISASIVLPDGETLEITARASPHRIQLDTNRVPLRESHEALRRAAESGDSSAAMVMATELQTCFRYGKQSESELERWSLALLS